MRARVGRPTIGPGGKTRTLSTRITPDLRLRIENGAKASGRSMASEIEHRLEMSYRDTDWAEEIAAVVRKEVQALRKLLGDRDRPCPLCGGVSTYGKIGVKGRG